MRGILVVAHGSRVKETEATLEVVLDMVKGKLPECVLEHAFMEFSDKTIGAAVEKLFEKGVTEIKIIPYFLFTGIHLKEDIPNMVKEYMADKPNINVIMGETLGADSRLCDILIDRIKD